MPSAAPWEQRGGECDGWAAGQVKNALADMFPAADFLLSAANENDTNSDIQLLGPPTPQLLHAAQATGAHEARRGGVQGRGWRRRW
eukprot:1014484-Rhodomonas_salina.1